MKDLKLIVLFIAIATVNADQQYGQQEEKRRHIKLHFGIHVPPIVVKLPRMNMPQVTIKANFLKQPNAKPLEVNLPPPPQISFGSPDDGPYGGGGGGGAYGGGGGGGAYGGGGYQGGGYGAPPAYGSSDTVSVQKSISQEQSGYGSAPPIEYRPPQGGYDGPPPNYGGPEGAQEGYLGEEYRRAYNAAVERDNREYNPSQYSSRSGYQPTQRKGNEAVKSRYAPYEKSAYYNQRA